VRTIDFRTRNESANPPPLCLVDFRTDFWLFPHAHTHTQAGTRVHTQAHAHMQACTHTYAHTYTHAHTCTCVHTRARMHTRQLIPTNPIGILYPTAQVGIYYSPFKPLSPLYSTIPLPSRELYFPLWTRVSERVENLLNFCRLIVWWCGIYLL